MSKNKLPHILTKEHISKLFDSVYIPKIAIAMFVSLMCGLRIQEIRNLEISEINLKDRRILIKNSKNPNRSKEGYGKDRVVPIPECAISPIKKWLNVVEGRSKWFLPSNKSSEIPTCKEHLHHGFDEARQRAGLNSIEYDIIYKKSNKISNRTGRKQFHIKWHSLRHFYATYVYEKTRDLYAVSSLLGHNQVSTTQIYAKISDKLKKETIDFAFNILVSNKQLFNVPMNQLNNTIPTIAKREKKSVEIL